MISVRREIRGARYSSGATVFFTPPTGSMKVVAALLMCVALAWAEYVDYTG